MGREKRNFVLLRPYHNDHPMLGTTIWPRTRWMEWRGRHSQEYAEKGINVDERFLLARGSKAKMKALQQAWENLVKGD